MEADSERFRKAGIIVVDSLRAAEESGDLREAAKSGAVSHTQQVTLAQVVSGEVTLPREGLVTFKSVATALQDLALAVRNYEFLRERPGLAAVPDLASIKLKK